MGLVSKFFWVPLLALAGCGFLSQVSGQGSGTHPGGKAKLVVSQNETTYGYTNAMFDKIGQQLDNPQQIFDKAGYTALWTASKADASSRLPQGLSVVPKEARVWEPWFRKHLTHNGQQLSTADLYKIKWTVIQAVANDPACQFKAGQSNAEIINSVEDARVKALKSLGLDDSNPVIFQISRADAFWARAKSQRDYAENRAIHPSLISIEEQQKRYPTLTELNAEQYSLNCVRSTLEMVYLLRGAEKLKPSGLSVGSLYTFLFNPDSGSRIAHGGIGIKVKLPDNSKAHLYYDPTAGKSYFSKSDMRLVSRDAGPLDQVSFERLANRLCITVKGQQPDGWEKDGIDNVHYVYTLAENFPEFGIGNFDHKATLPEGGFDYPSVKRGQVTFSQYHKSNLPKISSLSNQIDTVFSGQF